ncbi:recombinase family protein [Bradyrhizobium sp. UFLA05-109]
MPKVLLSKGAIGDALRLCTVSSKGQDYAGQVEALKAAVCERIFSEKASGKSISGRPEFDRLVRALPRTMWSRSPS